jgi:hypothetical protein
MKLLYCFCFLVLSFSAKSQKLMKGVVLDAEKNKPISNASVFLSTTSIGTITDEQGNFTLNIPNGRYDLIVSSIGYETHDQTINTSDLSDFLTIKLKVKTEVMPAVIIEPYEKDGWQRWGRFFIDNFIGTSGYAKDCKIKNTKVIHFRNSKKTNELLAFADEPLIIENKALGYTVRYQLESFSYSFKNHYLLYTGYPFFQPMSADGRKQKKWEKKRSEAYFGSMMHFMRSIYRNTIIEEGFEVRQLKKVLNSASQTENLFDSDSMYSVKMPDGSVVVSPIKTKRGTVYDELTHPDDYKDVIGKTLNGDSIAYAVNTTTAGLDFSDFLLVIYKNKTAPAEFRQTPRGSSSMMSQIVLINQQPIEIQANGSYYNPADLLNIGYWAWSEKIAMMLPFDYRPPKQ